MREKNIQLVSPGKNGQLIGEYGEPVSPPRGWIFLPAGDAGVTRKVTAQGKYWRVQYKKGRKTISKGIWAPAETILEAQQTVAAVRQTEGYQKKRIADLQRREKKQELYEGEFLEAVEKYLNFHDCYKLIARTMAKAITEHATPVGSGTVARTQLIPLEERASRAVIAWMRHKTTAYDKMQIARVKGERRAVRRELAQQSVQLLRQYRRGETIAADCPLRKAIQSQLKQFNHE
ncbi:DUF2293 domain-containing protein [Mangrovibacterium sp.]|uniref:DUF2293 domain-containing protein n=1 Tax=Mangrovibacterium sp. TaxID=1961364 RepID=UPI0035623C1F